MEKAYKVGPKDRGMGTWVVRVESSDPDDGPGSLLLGIDSYPLTSETCFVDIHQEMDPYRDGLKLHRNVLVSDCTRLRSHQRSSFGLNEEGENLSSQTRYKQESGLPLS